MFLLQFVKLIISVNVNYLSFHVLSKGKFYMIEKVQEGKDQEMAQSEKKIPTSKTEVGKSQTNNQVPIP